MLRTGQITGAQTNANVCCPCCPHALSLVVEVISEPGGRSRSYAQAAGDIARLIAIEEFRHASNMVHRNIISVGRRTDIEVE